MVRRKKKENRPTETEKKDGPAATASMENEHKASDLKETAGREDDKAADPKETAGGEHDNENKQPEEKLESVTAKRKRSKRNVVIAATGNAGTAGAARTAGTKGKIDSPKPPALAPPSATSSASPSPGVLASSPPATKGEWGWHYTITFRAPNPSRFSAVRESEQIEVG